MSTRLTYTELDSAIQNRMSGQAPSSGKRLEAINDALQELYAKYDLKSGDRESVLYIVPDGYPVALSSLASDLKKVRDLRYLARSKQNEQFEEVEDDDFAVHIGQGLKINEYSVPFNDGDLYLKVNSVYGYDYKLLHNMGDLTSNGTWSASDDAVNIGTTEVTTLEQAQSITFDIDVSNSVNNYATISNSDFAAVDLSDYVNLGKLKFYIYLPSVTDFTNIQAFWGDDASNNWNNTTTTQSSGSALVAGWNHITINWEGATKTGSPDSSSVNYLAIRLNYAAGFIDQEKVVVEQVRMTLPIPMKMVYSTYFLSKDSTGAFEEELLNDNNNNTLLLPKRYKELVVNKALQILIPEAIGEDDGRLAVVKLMNKEKTLVKELGLDIGDTPKRAARKFKIRKMW